MPRKSRLLQWHPLLNDNMAIIDCAYISSLVYTFVNFATYTPYPSLSPFESLHEAGGSFAIYYFAAEESLFTSAPVSHCRTNPLFSVLHRLHRIMQ